MASLYKKPVIITDPKTGEKVKTKSKKWWGRYRDTLGVERRVPLASDKTAAQAMLAELVRQVDRKRAGLADPTDDQRKRLLSEHIREFEQHLVSKGSTPDYVNTTIQRVKAIVDGCKFTRIDQISASRVQSFLAELRHAGRSIASSNHYQRAVKMFTRWLVRDRRSNEDRLAHLSKLNADLDRRRIRRPLSMEEFVRLLDAADNGPPIQNLPGPDRAILYITGIYTGYRRNEIGSVTTRSFDFESDPPTLTVEAGHSKHRRQDVLPLRHDFAQRVQTWIATKRRLQPNQPLFGIADKRTAEMLRKDLDAARARWINEATAADEHREREKSSFLRWYNEDGHVVDFHALRMTFITNLCKAGVSPKAAQGLARHSDVNLTLNTYTKLGVVDHAAAVEALPPLPASTTSQHHVLGATGTDGHGGRARPKKVPTMVPRGAENGAVRSAPRESQPAPMCASLQSTSNARAPSENAKTPEELGGGCTATHESASLSITAMRRKNPVPEVGLEPTPSCEDWILSPARDSHNDEVRQELRDHGDGEVPTVVPSPPGAVSGRDLSPDLSCVVAAWELLPDAIKAGILALVQTATTSRADWPSQVAGSRELK